MKVEVKHITKTKGRRLKWTPIKEAQSAPLSANKIKGRSLNKEIAAGDLKSTTKINLLVP